MIVRKLNDVQEFPVTQLVYKGQSLSMDGVGIRWLTHKGVGEANYKHNFAIRYFTIKPGSVIPSHDHEYVEGVFILKGKLRVISGEEETVVEPNDLLYVPSWEAHYLENIGEEEAAFICCIDCLGDKGNCMPSMKTNKC